MRVYLLSEHMKTKRTSLRKMIMLIPLFCVVLAIGFSALGGPDILKLSVLTVLNHWALLWMPALIALLAGLLHQIERRSTSYKLLLGMPLDLGKSWLAKCVLLILYSLAASLLLGLLLILVPFTVLTHELDMNMLLRALVSVFTCWLLSMWQIPACLWLATKTNLFVVLIMNTVVNVGVGAVAATASYWWAVPWGWSLRAAAPITGLHPNGIPLEAGNALLDISVLPIAVGLSLVLCIAVYLFTSRTLVKLEVK